MKANTYQSILLPIMLCLPWQVIADQFVSFKDYEIHYSAFSSLIIPADVASAHTITRSKNRIVTNISVRQGEKSVAAEVNGTVKNLLGQVLVLEFSEVIEQDAIYYLANHVIDERDQIHFNIRVQPVNTTGIYELNFTRRYY